MENLKQLVGKVKENASEDWKSAAGLTLIVWEIDKNGRLLVIRPIKLDEMEKFYKISYENGMKKLISDDYDYCIWYLLDEDCELTCEININDLEEVREATAEDIKEHNKNIEEFKKLHKFYECEKRMKEELQEDEKCVEEFEKQDKVNFKIKITEDTFLEEKGIVYRGFVIHDKCSAITIIDGEYEGLKLCNCRPREAKKIIDKITDNIGEKNIDGGNREVIVNILKSFL